MKLPKLYRPVKVKFWSLRMGLGPSMGVVFDCDIEVERIARRVLIPGGWKWQIKDLNEISEWDNYAYQDQDILNEYGSDIEITRL